MTEGQQRPRPPTSAMDVMRTLGDLTKTLDDLVNDLESAELQWAHAEAAADAKESRAFIRADGSMDLRKHLARVAAETERTDARIAEATVRALKARMRAIELRVEVGRSFGAALRAEAGAAGWTP